MVTEQKSPQTSNTYKWQHGWWWYRFLQSKTFLHVIICTNHFFFLLFIIASTIFPSVVSAKLPKKQTVIIINTSTTHLQRKILKNCFPWINMFSATAIFSATKQQHEVWFLSKIWTRQKVHTLDSRTRLSPQTSRDFFLIIFFFFSQQDLQQRLRAFPQSATNET